MQSKWIFRLKTFGLVILVAFGINLLLVLAYALGAYDKALGDSFHRAVLITVALVIVRLWQQWDQTVPLFGEPLWRWRWLEGKPDRKLAMLLLVALIAVSSVAMYLALHRQQDEWAVVSMTPANNSTNPYAKFADMPDWAQPTSGAEAVSRALADYCKGRAPELLTDAEMAAPPDEFRSIKLLHCWK